MFAPLVFGGPLSSVWHSSVRRLPVPVPVRIIVLAFVLSFSLSSPLSLSLFLSSSPSSPHSPVLGIRTATVQPASLSPVFARLSFSLFPIPGVRPLPFGPFSCPHRTVTHRSAPSSIHRVCSSTIRSAPLSPAFAHPAFCPLSSLWHSAFHHLATPVRHVMSTFTRTRHSSVRRLTIPSSVSGSFV